MSAQEATVGWYLNRVQRLEAMARAATSEAMRQLISDICNTYRKKAETALRADRATVGG